MKKYWWVFIIAAPVLAFGMAAIMVYYMLNVWTYQGQATIFEINRGEGFSKINGKLYSKGLISSPKLFHRYAQINDLMTKFKAGKYEIKSGSTMLGVIDTLIKGQSITNSVTIPEGKNLFQIAQILEDNKIISSKERFIMAAKDPTFTSSLGIKSKRIEGFLYPETYNFTPPTPVKDVISTMVNVFKSKTSEINFDKAPLGLSLFEVVTLASVVEKETGAAHERPQIAGVFLNRLRKRMRLQSDPTTIYGIYETFDGNLRKRDLLNKTPYNTYKIPALPVGPIANPGLASIKAVLNPESHSFLYFVSLNNGTHYFSKTYKEHKAAVERYQKRRSARKGKSWRDLNK